MDDLESGFGSHVRGSQDQTNSNTNQINSNVRVDASHPSLVDVEDPEQTLNYAHDEQSQSTQARESDGNVAKDDKVTQDRISRLEILVEKLLTISSKSVDNESEKQEPPVGSEDPDMDLYETAQPGYVSSRRVRIDNLPRSPTVSPNVDEDQFFKDPGASHSSTRVEDQRWRNVAPQQLVPINQVNPPMFNGDKTKARAWLKEYDNTMEINGFGNPDKMKRAFAYTSGPARSWYNVTMSLKPNLDWPAFKKEFILHFCGADGQVHLRRRLDETTQKGDEHPTDYVMRMLDLCLQYNSKMSEEEKIDRLAHGLRLDIYNHLIVVKPDMTEWKLEWLLACLAAYRTKEDNKRSAETFQRNSGASSNRSKSPSSKATTPPKPKDLSTWVCFNCDAKGHLIEDCKQPKNEEKISACKSAYREQKLQQRAANSISRACKQEPQLTRLPCDNLPKPMLTVDINGKNVLGRIDTGADMTVLPSNVARDLNLTILQWTQPPFMAANNSSIKFLGMSPTLITINGSQKTLLVAVAPKENFKQTLFGNDLLCLFNVQLNFGAKECEVVPEVVDVHKTIPKIVASIEKPKQHPLDQVQFGDLDQESRAEFEAVLLEREHVFSKNELDIGRTTTIRHRIHLKDDVPVHSHPYRIPPRYVGKLEEIVNRTLATGAIRESKSPYASPVFLVSKDNGTDKRLVADYRALNAKTVPDRAPMPHPEDVFGLLSGSTVFVKLDITSMFNQIEVDERDIEKTAITTPLGLFECPLIPFGLMNAPATAVRLMREVLRGLDRKTCYVYFDDIIIFARNVPELLCRCTEVLDRIHAHGLKLKPSKCSFAMSQVKFLGHIISPQGIAVDPQRIENVLKFKIPQNSSDVRSFHGLCNYNRKFIKGFAEIAKPLNPLMGDPEVFEWTPECQAAFEALRNAIVQAPVLVHYNPDADHELRTDASSHSIGAVLYQIHPADKNQCGVVLYHSKALDKAQRNYCTTDREFLAVYESVMTLKHYLLGKEFTLVTDHKPLSLIRNCKDPHHRMARWVAQLQAFEFKVVYKKGKDHVDADCMSRLVEDTYPVECEDFSSIARAINSIINPDESDGDEDAELPEVDEPVDMRSEQLADEFCRKYIDILESQDMSDSEKCRRARNYTMQNDILHYVRQNDIFLTVIPERRRSAVLLSCHDVPLAGHLGFKRTYAIIKCRFFWPKMRRDIKQYVTSCRHCQRRKAPNTRREGLIQPLPIAENVFDTMGIDLMTKLPATYSGYNTILVCTDNLSKYVITVPLKNELAETIIHAFFNNVVAKFGCPKVVLSDRGSNISGERSRDFFRLFGIKRKLTSAYHPQTNGQTERFNRTLATALTAYVSKNQRDWSDYIQAITFAYNITEHSVTSIAPHELVFGQKPRLPIDNLLDRHEFIDPARPKPGVLSSTTTNIMKQLILKNQNANKRRLDHRLAPCTYKEGDLVLVERPTRIRGTAHKLTYTYVGPYKIAKKLSDLSYEINNVKGYSGSTVVHPCHLKRFKPRTGNVADELINPTFVPKEQVDDSEDDILAPAYSPIPSINDSEDEQADAPPTLSPPHAACTNLLPDELTV